MSFHLKLSFATQRGASARRPCMKLSRKQAHLDLAVLLPDGVASTIAKKRDDNVMVWHPHTDGLLYSKSCIQ